MMFVTFARPSSGASVSVNADRITYVTVDTRDAAYSVLHFGHGETLVVKGELEGVVKTLQNAVR